MILDAHLIAELSRLRAVREDLPAACGVSFHSQRVRPGDVFFALPGASDHGIRFAEAALATGAAFIVSDRPHPRGVQVEKPAEVLLELGKLARSQLRGPVIGITGSAGKTSTKALAAAALAATASPGNFNTPLALARVLVDTCLEGGEGPLVLELGIDEVGDMAVLLELTRPTHGVLTLVAESHTQYLGDLTTVAREKSQLLEAAQVALVSSQAAPYLAPELRAESLVYGLEGEPGVTFGGRVKASFPDAQVLEVAGQTLKLPYPGEAMARNAVAALALARVLDFDLTSAAQRLEGVRLEPGRLQFHHFDGFTLIDDSYNSNPASARAALAVLRACPGPHAAILGDMLELEKSAALHEQLGEATRGLSRVIAIGTEAEAVKRGNPEVRAFASLEAASSALESLPLTGALLVKASRGMALERIVAQLSARKEKVA
jgi:UDP-N-acetylmuramoyl-tripeptide--D-alanyl-D-alanine ligase